MFEVKKSGYKIYAVNNSTIILILSIIIMLYNVIGSITYTIYLINGKLEFNYTVVLGYAVDSLAVIDAILVLVGIYGSTEHYYGFRLYLLVGGILKELFFLYGSGVEIYMMVHFKIVYPLIVHLALGFMYQAIYVLMMVKYFYFYSEVRLFRSGVNPIYKGQYSQVALGEIPLPIPINFMA